MNDLWRRFLTAVSDWACALYYNNQSPVLAVGPCWEQRSTSILLIKIEYNLYTVRDHNTLRHYETCLYMVRHHETSLTKEISSFLVPSHLQSPLRALPLPSSSSTSTVSQVRTIFFTILSIATKSFFITRSIVILKEWKEIKRLREWVYYGGRI